MVRDDAAEGVDESLLELAGGDRGELRAGDLAQVGPELDLVLRRDERCRFGRPRKTRGDHPIEPDALEERPRGQCLLAALARKRHVVRRDRLPGVVEVRHGAVAHQVEATAHDSTLTQGLRRSGVPPAAAPGARAS